MDSTKGVRAGKVYLDMPVNYLSVENVDQFARKAESLGAKVVVPKTPVPGMGWFAQLTDTEGNIFGVHQADVNAK